MSSVRFERLGFLLLPVLLTIPAVACSDAPSHTLRIDFSQGAEALAGAQLFVDGELAGELRPDGSVNATEFRVSTGDHTLELRKEGYQVQAFELLGAEAGGTSDLQARSAAWFIDGEMRNALVLER